MTKDELLVKIMNIVHQYKFTCTIPHEDFEQILNAALEHAIEVLEKHLAQAQSVFESATNKKDKAHFGARVEQLNESIKALKGEKYV